MYTWEKGSWKWISLCVLNLVIFIFYQLKLIKVEVSCGLTQYMAIFPFFNQENSFSMINIKKELTQNGKIPEEKQEIEQKRFTSWLRIMTLCWIFVICSSLIHASLFSNLLGTQGGWSLWISQQLSLVPSRWLASGLVGVLAGGQGQEKIKFRTFIPQLSSSQYAGILCSSTKGTAIDVLLFPLGSSSPLFSGLDGIMRFPLLSALGASPSIYLL